MNKLFICLVVRVIQIKFDKTQNYSKFLVTFNKHMYEYVYLCLNY